MSRELQPYHHAWLSVHPERNEAWLRDRLKDGFDIHHLDGDHENNDPINLVLIESADHMMLHNGKTRLSRIRPRKIGRLSEDIELQKNAYEAFNPRTGWPAVAENIGLGYSNSQKAMCLAKKHAFRFGLKWPLSEGKPKQRKRSLGHSIPNRTQQQSAN